MIGYLDLPSGLSGDMFLGCLIDAGWPLDDLGRTVTALGLPRNEWALDARAVMKGPLRATLLTVQTAEPQTHEVADPGHASPPAPTAGLVGFHVFPQSADPIHLPGHHHHHDDAHDHAHSHAHDHPHDHGHGSHHHHGPQRRLADVRAIIESSSLSSAVKDRALAVFVRLAQAEAKVHGTTPDQIHFHEVGAVDAIIDIVGVVAGLDALGIDALYASCVPVGDGWVNTAHGRLPVPAPATLELLAAAGVPTRPSPSPGAGELLTPTGAALLAELATFHQPEMELRRIGIGAGRRDCAWPNIARLWLGELRQAGPMVQLETNIDDMNPQLYEPVMQQLLAAGASDVWLTPVQMKKGRPAVVLSVLAATPLESALTDIILRQTTTLGVRVQAISHRSKARREMRQVATAFGDVPVKVKWVGNDLVGAFPEFDDCRRLAEKHGVPVRTVHEAALAAAREAFPLSAAPTPPATT